MARIAIVIGALALISMVVPTAFAQTQATPGQYPNVANLKPFSAEADFMSLAGYLRYLIFQQTGQWLTRQEAVRIVQQQSGQ